MTAIGEAILAMGATNFGATTVVMIAAKTVVKVGTIIFAMIAANAIISAIVAGPTAIRETVPI
ncbi:MAG: hypothetical protein HDQ93_04460 [Desulfovibrio sp.]|nr:hypothetical protein [Desulfovibrio sp.]